MKRIGLIVVFFMCMINAFADYTVDGRNRSEEQDVVSKTYRAGWLGEICFHRTVVDFDTLLSIGLIERRYKDYAKYPEDGVLMLKLGNNENLKLFRAHVEIKKDSYYREGASEMTYQTECLYRLEPGMFDKIVDNGITKFRVQYLNNQFVDEEIKPKKVEKQKTYLREVKAKLYKKVEDDF
ncbi:MAG: hypothetical protein U0K71_01685 [Paludibacteraceae bacterium]|nr:hypothetical protein [Paludibacteraceae bacterium]